MSKPFRFSIFRERNTFLGLFISGWYEQSLNIHNQKCFIKHANVTIAILVYIFNIILA